MAAQGAPASSEEQGGSSHALKWRELQNAILKTGLWMMVIMMER